jgi:hypothetical protein
MAINHNVQLQSMLYSFNNSALYLGNTKVESMEMLVPQMVKAFTQLRDQLNSYSCNVTALIKKSGHKLPLRRPSDSSTSSVRQE